MKTIIAIDPGKHGGMAVNALGKTWCAGLPESDGDRLELLEAEQYAAGREGLKAIGANLANSLPRVTAELSSSSPTAFLKAGANRGAVSHQLSG